MPIDWQLEGSVATIAIRGYNQHNPMDYEMYEDLDRRLREVDQNPDIRVAILTGAGGKHFSAGHNLKSANAQMESGEDRDVYDVRPFYFNDLPPILTRRTETPIVGATQGWCLASAMLIFCHHTSVRIAGESTRFGLMEIKRALATATAQARLATQMPYATVMWMATTGEHIDAYTALRVGFVNEVVSDELVLTRAREVAAMIAECPPLSVRAEKVTLSDGERIAHSKAVAFARALAALNCLDPETLSAMRNAVRLCSERP